MYILVIDDEYPFPILDRLAKRHGIRIALARTRAQGAEQAAQEPSPDLILMDGYLDGDHDSLFLIKLIRRDGYTGPMVAISSDDKMQAKLLEAGCTEAWAKGDIPELLERWIAEHSQ